MSNVTQVEMVSVNEFEIKKPLYISKKSIVELDELFSRWEKIIEERCRESKFDKNFNAEITLLLHDGTIIKGKSAIAMFKRPEPQNVDFKSLIYSISYEYPALIKVEIVKATYSSWVKISCNESIDLELSVNDYYYDFKDWILSVQISPVRSFLIKFVRFFYSIGLIFIFAGFLVPSFFSQNPIKESIRALLENGVTADEQSKGIELLLIQSLGVTKEIGPVWENQFYWWYFSGISCTSH